MVKFAEAFPVTQLVTGEKLQLVPIKLFEQLGMLPTSLENSPFEGAVAYLQVWKGTDRPTVDNVQVYPLDAPALRSLLSSIEYTLDSCLSDA